MSNVADLHERISRAFNKRQDASAEPSPGREPADAGIPREGRGGGTASTPVVVHLRKRRRRRWLSADELLAAVRGLFRRFGRWGMPGRADRQEKCADLLSTMHDALGDLVV